MTMTVGSMGCGVSVAAYSETELLTKRSAAQFRCYRSDHARDIVG